ncbi:MULTISPECIES: ABC transporter permease [unclassified Mesorhizobium]|uniref:ABC transporter permease n=1 Tax=unclassified Mesorhizobium TaxID=325217 RepID=UPI000964ED5E|nr:MULTISPECIES: ABC transporter permease [unclassified Mesorhizobium]MBN9258499.1 ABC transporter permease [Mesorhizobium sp.]OJX77363.1 MAG: maltose ABC transporter permease [Mesorhizobium sp. 65-26]
MPGRLRWSPALIAGLLLLAVPLLPIVVGPFLVTPEMADVFGDVPNLPPSALHPLGTQSEGRDLLAALMLGTPSTLTIGLIGGGTALLIGGILGLLSGYLGGWVDSVVRTVVDVGLTIPPLAILILVAASFPIVSIVSMGLIVAATAWMGPTRVIRAQILSLREREFVRVAKLSDAGTLRIVFLELMPNLIPFLAASFVNAMTTAILASIGLEVLGLGPRQSYTLGNTIYEAVYYTAMWRGMWWWWLPPIVVLVCIFVGLFLVSHVLDRVANPRLERGQ